jgi:hypothetical protein
LQGETGEGGRAGPVALHYEKSDDPREDESGVPDPMHDRLFRYGWREDQLPAFEEPEQSVIRPHRPQAASRAENTNLRIIEGLKRICLGKSDDRPHPDCPTEEALISTLADHSELQPGLGRATVARRFKRRRGLGFMSRPAQLCAPASIERFIAIGCLTFVSTPQACASNRSRPMQSHSEWVLASDAWTIFTQQHPELGLRPASGSSTTFCAFTARHCFRTTRSASPWPLVDRARRALSRRRLRLRDRLRRFAEGLTVERTHTRHPADDAGVLPGCPTGEPDSAPLDRWRRFRG